MGRGHVAKRARSYSFSISTNHRSPKQRPGEGQVQLEHRRRRSCCQKRLGRVKAVDSTWLPCCCRRADVPATSVPCRYPVDDIYLCKCFVEYGRGRCCSRQHSLAGSWDVIFCNCFYGSSVVRWLPHVRSVSPRDFGVQAIRSTSFKTSHPDHS